MIIGRKSELAWVQGSETPQEELGAAGGSKGVSGRRKTGYLNFKGVRPGTPPWQLLGK